MDELRKEVNSQIKKTIVPKLREHGFTGSFPHFRRIYEDGRVDYLSFQFNKWGGSFIAEMAVAYPYKGKEGNFYYWNEVTVDFVKKSNYSYTNKRLRISPMNGEWFEYTKENYVKTVEEAEKLILENLSYFEK